MNIEEYRDYCIGKKAVTESFPFDNKTLVFKVAGKMFALTGVDSFDYINLKCDPERAIELRDTYNGVKPGYHMNKQLWNSVYTEQDVPDQLIYELIDHSYELIVASLTKKARSEYALG
ncbi:MAG: MmcQ/YjbR family DNA-binding protein [Crocinitomicaceae bacterium]